MTNDAVCTSRMKWSKCFVKTLLGASAVLLASFLFIGCGQTTGAGAGSGMAKGTDGAGSTTSPRREDKLRVGNKVRIEFAGYPSTDVMLPHEEQIKDNGTITGLPYITNAVPAEGKTTRELEQDIHALYVPKFFTHLTVTVTSTDRYYSVGGEVNRPGPVQYVGDVTLIKAIHAAGDFTIFAKKTKVRLTRAGASKPIIIDCDKALEDPALDVEVYPGDIIFVPRRIL